MQRARRITFAAFVLIVAANVTAHAQQYSVLYNFGSNTGDPTGPRYSGIIAQGRDGAFYSTADNHWTDGHGVAFRITRSGSVTVLHRFTGPDGEAPVGGLTLASDGNYYGTSIFGGQHAKGTIFRITAKGAVTVLYSFTGGADGSIPQSPPIEGFDGDLYGTTVGGSNNADFGSIYKITPQGKFTVLHTFSFGDGAELYAPLVQAHDGAFYGTAFSGGSHGYGTIFRISPSGRFTVLFNFDVTHGANPFAPLILANDGNFYGVTTQGGQAGGGVAFRITPAGSVHILHNFTGGQDGMNQVGALMQATDGNLYGTNNLGGAFWWGVLFRLTLTGEFTVLHDFEWFSGASPQAPLLQHTSGVLYSTTAVGGLNNDGEGTFYKLNLNLPPFITFDKAVGNARETIGILGQGFSHATAVSFNGIPATFTVVSNTFLTATVPHHAKTGFVTVTTATGTLRSNRPFVVLKSRRWTH
jgi:uncharacterized repeat protein (TIGR03803 family)